MSVSLFTSLVPNGPDATVLRPGDWNAAAGLLNNLFNAGTTEPLSVSGANPYGGGTQSGTLSVISDASSPYSRVVLSANDSAFPPNLQLLVRNVGAHIGLNIGNTSSSAVAITLSSGHGVVSITGSGYQAGSDFTQITALKQDNVGFTITSTKGPICLISTGDRLQFGGTTASFPALRRNTTDLEVRLADDSGYGILKAFAFNISNGAALLYSAVAITDRAAAGAGTLTNAPAAGNPTKWMAISDNGTLRAFPTWLV